MFMSGGMKQDLWPVGGENAVNSFGIGYVGDDGFWPAGFGSRRKIRIEFMETVFVPIEKHKGRRRERADLPSELGPNRTSGAADKHAFPADEAADGFSLQADWHALKQVLDRHRPDLTDRDFAVKNPSKIRQCLDWNLERLECSNDLTDGRGARPRHRDENRIRRLSSHDPGEFLARSEYLHAVNAVSNFGSVIVDEPNGFVVI